MRLLIAAFLVDQVGSWSYVIVISVYVWDRTHSTLWLAALGICRWGPACCSPVSAACSQTGISE